MPSDSRLKRLESIVDMPLYRFSRLLSEAGSLIVRVCEGQFGITRREWRILSYLAPHDGVPPSGLSRMAGLDKAQTSRTVASMMEKGLLLRTALPSDRRHAVLQLTPAGRELHDRILPLIRHINRELLSVLSTAEIEQLDAMLDRLQTQAEQVKAQLDADLPRAIRHKGRVRGPAS